MIKIEELAKIKHGKTIILAVLVILITICTSGVLYVASKMRSAPPEKTLAKEEKKVDPPTDVAEDRTPSTQQDMRYGDINSAYVPAADSKECDNRFPINGFKKVFRADWASANAAKSVITFENKTDAPIWLKLKHPTADFPVLGIMIYPLETLKERINIGLYGVEFSKGTKWCNQATGLTDVKTMVLAKNVPIGKTNSIILRITVNGSGKPEASIIDTPLVEDPNSSIGVLDKI